MDIKSVTISIPEGTNLILGQSHFIKTVEDLYEILAGSLPSAKFATAFSEASGPCLIRAEGNDQELQAACIGILKDLACGHIFCILLKNAFPINVLNAIKACPEVCRIFCATANPLEVLLAQSAQGRGVLGVIDGFSPKGVESPKERDERHSFLRKIAYKL
jgi:hypothetical protein